MYSPAERSGPIEAMNALAHAGLPPKEAFVEPYQRVTLWDYPAHPHIGKVEGQAKQLTSLFEHVASLRVSTDTEITAVGEAQAKQEEEFAYAREILQAMRDLHRELTQGLAIRRVHRDVRRYVPHLASQFETSMSAATNQIAEMRAFLAFLVEEDDDLELGIDLVPAEREPMEPEDSTPAPT